MKSWKENNEKTKGGTWGMESGEGERILIEVTIDGFQIILQRKNQKQNKQINQEENDSNVNRESPCFGIACLVVQSVCFSLSPVFNLPPPVPNHPLPFPPPPTPFSFFFFK